MYNITITSEKARSGRLEGDVNGIVRFLIANYLYHVDAWIEKFKDECAALPRSNNFSADLMYKCFKISETDIEIWKLTAHGEKKKKMYSINFKFIKS